MHFQSHEAYIAAQPTEVRERLQKVQREVEARVPEATRTISYNMPAYRLGRTFFYFGAFKKHIGIYPPVTRDQALVRETAPFRGPKGNLSFPHAEELPLPLIGRVAVALAARYRTE